MQADVGAVFFLLFAWYTVCMSGTSRKSSTHRWNVGQAPGPFSVEGVPVLSGSSGFFKRSMDGLSLEPVGCHGPRSSNDELPILSRSRGYHPLPCSFQGKKTTSSTSSRPSFDWRSPEQRKEPPLAEPPLADRVVLVPIHAAKPWCIGV